MFQSGLSSLMFAWPFVWPGGVLYTSFEIIYHVMSCNTTVLCFFFCCFLILTEENLVHFWIKAHSPCSVGWLENLHLILVFEKKITCISSCHRICTGRGAGHYSLSSREWYQKMTTAPFLALFSFSPFSSTQLGWLLFRYRKFFLLRLHTTGRLLTAKDHFNASQWKNCWNWQTWCMTDRHKNWCYYHIKVWKSQPY